MAAVPSAQANKLTHSRLRSSNRNTMVGRRQRAGGGGEGGRCPQDSYKKKNNKKTHTKKRHGVMGKRWWSVSFICQALCVPDGGPVPTGMPSTDGRTDGQICTWRAGRGEPGAGARLSPGEGGAAHHPHRQPAGFSEPRRGEGQGGSTLACASSPAAAGAAQRGRARQGAAGVPGAPRAPAGPPPAPPRPSPARGRVLRLCCRPGCPRGRWRAR